MKNKKWRQALFVLAVFLITIVGSVVIIWLLSPAKNTDAVSDYSKLQNTVMFSASECSNVLGKSEKYIDGFLGSPSSTLEKVTNDKPGDKTNIYKTSSANFKITNRSNICTFAQLWDDKIPAPRGIKIGMQYEEVMKKYPIQVELDGEYKPYNSDSKALQYRTIYGEYEVTSSYAISVWNIGASQSTTPIELKYCDREAEVSFYFRNGILNCIEYLSK